MEEYAVRILVYSIRILLRILDVLYAVLRIQCIVDVLLMYSRVYSWVVLYSTPGRRMRCILWRILCIPAAFLAVVRIHVLLYILVYCNIPEY